MIIFAGYSRVAPLEHGTSRDIALRTFDCAYQAKAWGVESAVCRAQSEKTFGAIQGESTLQAGCGKRCCQEPGAARECGELLVARIVGGGLCSIEMQRHQLGGIRSDHQWSDSNHSKTMNSLGTDKAQPGRC